MESSCLEESAVRRLLTSNRELQVEVQQKMLVLQKQIEENDMFKRKMSDVYKHMHHKGILAQGLEVCWHKEKKTLVVPLEDKCVEVPATRYFVSKQGTVPKPNEDTVRLADVYRFMPIPLKIPEWKEQERECLRNALLEEVVQLKLTNMYRSKQQQNKTSNSIVDGGSNEGANGDSDGDGDGDDLDLGMDLAAAYTALQTCRRDMDLSQGDDRELLGKVDWEKVTQKVAMAGYSERDVEECKFQWYCNEDPKLMKGKDKDEDAATNANANANANGKGGGASASTLTVEEGNRLLDIAQKYSMKDWDRILAELSPADENIKPMACLKYFQEHRTNRSIVHKWSEDEDKLLKAAVEEYERENKTHWNKWVIVANSVPNKSARQCLQRWRNYNMKINNEQATGNPKYTREWSSEEDLALKNLVEEHGPKWKKVSQGIPNKTDRQCRQRYIHINPNLKQTEWTEKEKFQLNDVVIANYHANLGRIKWADVGQEMQRCRNLCRKRWHRISTTYFGATLRELIKECVMEVLEETPPLMEAAKTTTPAKQHQHQNQDHPASKSSGAGTSSNRGKQPKKKVALLKEKDLGGQQQKENRRHDNQNSSKRQQMAEASCSSPDKARRSYWSKQEELDLLRVLRDYFDAPVPVQKIMWTSIQDQLPRSVMKCKRKLGFIQQHLAEDVVNTCAEALAKGVLQEVAKEEGGEGQAVTQAGTEKQQQHWYSSDLLQEAEAEGPKRQNTGNE